mgnify:CR=1 FL=1
MTETQTRTYQALRAVDAFPGVVRRTLASGTTILDTAVAPTKSEGGSVLAGDQAFALHDTYGFPYDLTRELVAERGLSVDDEGFDELMDAQRERARTGGVAGESGGHEEVIGFVGSAPATRFDAPARTSPAVNTPGRTVSSRCGSRSLSGQARCPPHSAASLPQSR